MKLPEQEAKRFITLYSSLIGWCSGRLDPSAKVRDERTFLKVEMSEKIAARDRMLDQAWVIDEFLAKNPEQLCADDLAIIGAWRNFVRDDLVIERQLKRHTVYLDWSTPPVAYAVMSLLDEVVDMLPIPPPVFVEAVLLPWGKVIVCDGMVRFKPIYFGPGVRRNVKAAYREAKARGIITTLDPGAEAASKPKLVVPAAKKAPRKAPPSRRKQQA